MNNEQRNNQRKEDEKKEKPEPERYEWLVVQRLKKTGNPVRTIALDPQTDAIISRQDNKSEWIREAIMEKATREQKTTFLTEAEEDVYAAASSFFCQLSYKDERFPEHISDELSAKLFDFLHEKLSDFSDEFWDAPAYALNLVSQAREDTEFWLKLYEKIRTAYLKDLRRPRGKFGEPID